MEAKREAAKMTATIKTIKNEADGFQVEIAEHVNGFSIVIRDTDCGICLPNVKIVPTLEWAESVAEAWANGKEA